MTSRRRPYVQQVDFWPQLKTRPMVACARISFVRGGLTGDSLAAAVHGADAPAAHRAARPDGNHGDNEFRPKAQASAKLKGTE